MVDKSVGKFDRRLAECKKAISSLQKDASNEEKRLLASDLGLLQLDAQEDASLSPECVKSIEEAYTALLPSLSFRQVPRDKHWYDGIDTITRFLAVPLTFITMGIFFPFPLMVTQFLERVLRHVGIYFELSVLIRKFVAHYLLWVTGLVADVRVDKEFYKHKRTLVMFQHNSSADPILVGVGVPTTCFCFGKMELFMMPFMGWLGLALGGRPVDRGHQGRAKNSFNGVLNACRRHGDAKCCIMIAPEGTRSKSGNVLDFKKGPFYLYEDFKAPVVPMITFGNNDLYTVGSWVNLPGSVILKFLKPILPSEVDALVAAEAEAKAKAGTGSGSGSGEVTGSGSGEVTGAVGAARRSAMARLLRRRMLVGLKERIPPEELARYLTWPERLRSLLCIALVLWVDVHIVRFAQVHARNLIPHIQGLVDVGDGAALSLVWVGAFFASVLVSLVLHLWNVYLCALFDSSSKKD